MTFYLKSEDGDIEVAETLSEAIVLARPMAARGDVTVTIHGGSTGPALYRVIPAKTIRPDPIVVVGGPS